MVIQLHQHPSRSRLLVQIMASLYMKHVRMIHLRTLASETHAKRLMELLLQYAGGTAAPQPLILAAGPAQSGANVM